MRTRGNIETGIMVDEGLEDGIFLASLLWQSCLGFRWW